MHSLSRIMRADWGAPIKSAAYRAAYMVAVLIIVAELTYRAGMATGRAIHWLSDRLGGLASGRIDRTATARAIVSWARATIEAPAPAPAPAPNPAPLVVAMACAPAPAEPVAIASPPIEALTVAQLRKLARARGMSKLARNGRRADLISALV
jgi:hypothetical protein